MNDVNIVSSAVNAFLGIGHEVISCMADPWNAGIILQCLLIGGVIQLITKMGAARALATAFSKHVNTPRKAQLRSRSNTDLLCNICSNSNYCGLLHSCRYGYRLVHYTSAGSSDTVCGIESDR